MNKKPYPLLQVIKENPTVRYFEFTDWRSEIWLYDWKEDKVEPFTYPEDFMKKMYKLQVKGQTKWSDLKNMKGLMEKYDVRRLRSYFFSFIAKLKRESAEQVKKMYFSMLEDLHVNENTNFKDVYAKMEEDERFLDVVPEEDRVELWNMFLNQKMLEKFDAEQAHAEKRMRDFNDMLEIKYKQGWITHRSLWKDVELKILQEPSYLALDNEDRLIGWDKFITRRIEEYEKCANSKSNIHHTDIERRKSFWKMLENNESLHAFSKWSDVQNQIQRSSEYQEIPLGRPSPEDVFHAYIKYLKDEYDNFMSKLKTGVDLQYVRSFDEFQERFQSEIPLRVYTAWFYQKEESERNQENLELEKLKSDFLTMLACKGEIYIKTEFKDITPLLKTTVEWKALTEHPKIREALFTKHVTNLREEKKRRKRKRVSQPWPTKINQTSNSSDTSDFLSRIQAIKKRKCNPTT